MNILFGSSGSLGSELAHHIMATPLIAADRFAQTHYELAADLRMHHADVIINCAAFTGIDRCHDQMIAATRANVAWPKLLAKGAESVRANLLHISTEAVFRGDILGKRYAESDKPDPTTYYGTTKLDGEVPSTIRLPLLFGPTNGKQIVACLVRRLLHGEQVDVACDLFTTPVYTPDVAKWIGSNLGLSRPITHLASDQIISLFDLVDQIVRVAGGDTKPRAVLAAKFGGKEPKPLCLGLRSEFTQPFSLDGGVLKYAEWIQQNREDFMNDLQPAPPPIQWI